MLTLEAAKSVLQLARDFYGADGALKSSNKWYGFNVGEEHKAAETLAKARGLTTEQARARVDRRAASLLADRPKRLAEEERLKLTPVEYGAMLVHSKQTSGNCGEMAVVAMYFASEGPCQPKDMSLVTASNGWTRRSLTDSMTFGHSWALLGAEGTPQFVVDPWSGVACAKDNFQEEFTAKMNKWQQQGKRVLVQFKTGSDYLCANDSKILTLFNSLATTKYTRGDVKFQG